MVDEFAARDTVVIAVAQEDEDLASHGRMAGTLKPEPRFELVADLERAETAAYDRTTAYLIDASGTVRQVFPMIIHARPSWGIILKEVDAMREHDARAAEAK